MDIANWINGESCPAETGNWLDKINPHDGAVISRFADSSAKDTAEAVSAAENSILRWAGLTPVKRGKILANVVTLMKERADELADCVAVETGKPPQDAKGEVSGAILQGEYFAGEGMRLYGRSLTSGMPGKHSHTIRQPRGIAGLIVPANTPIANIAWKSFPALICGNTVVMKAADDSPRIADLFARITKEAGVPDGVFNVIQGLGRPAGSSLVEDHRVNVVSFTGSTDVGRWIAGECGKRLARVSLELGGKNPLVVCDDADLDQAVHWASLSAFSNAGQRCASGSRILVFNEVYETFKAKLVEKANSLKLGVDTGDDLGPVINDRQHRMILESLIKAKADGSTILCGGSQPDDPELQKGYYVQPTLLENVDMQSELSCKELFGPVATLHPVADLHEALEVANATEYGLTSAIHTASVDRAMWFVHRVKSGTANINLGTFGSEPHMPFGGFGASGNGTREPGVEALDVYSELKNITYLTRDQLI